MYIWGWWEHEHISFSNLSISVKPDKTIPRVWKLPLQKGDMWVGVRCLWCRPDTAQECAISCFLQHQKNQRARDHLPAHSSNPSSQKVLHRGDLSQGTAPRLCLAICAPAFFFLYVVPWAICCCCCCCSCLSLTPYSITQTALCQSALYTVLRGVGHSFRLETSPMP